MIIYICTIKTYAYILYCIHTTITNPMKGHCDMSSGSQCPAFNRSDLKHQTSTQTDFSLQTQISALFEKHRKIIRYTV